jgi:hypothetical protein
MWILVSEKLVGRGDQRRPERFLSLLLMVVWNRRTSTTHDFQRLANQLDRSMTTDIDHGLIRALRAGYQGNCRRNMLWPAQTTYFEAGTPCVSCVEASFFRNTEQ